MATVDTQIDQLEDLRDRTGWYTGFKRFLRKQPLGSAGLFIVVVMVVVAIFAPQLSSLDPESNSFETMFIAPGAEFFLGTGYDFVPVGFGMTRLLFQKDGPDRRGQAATTMVEAHYAANHDRTSTRYWAEQGSGLITDDASFDNFDWPDPDQEPYHDVARLGEILPREAKVIPLLGYIYAASWMLMGFERFCLDHLPRVG